MEFLVVYESMYGNTHLVADRIAQGLRHAGTARVVSVHEATHAMVEAADAVVVGGPTHVHGMSRPTTRAGAANAATKPTAELTMDPDAEGVGLREWFDDLGTVHHVRAAAFDTRIDKSPVVTGRASRGIEKRLERHGFEVIADSESFLVDTHNRLLPGEAERAVEWGRMLVMDEIPVM